MRYLVATIILLASAACASSGPRPTQTASTEPAEITEENPGYYEPEMHKRYHDKRYEGDEEFKDYYKWKKK